MSEPAEDSCGASERKTVLLIDGDVLAYLAFGYNRLSDDEIEQIVDTGSMSRSAIDRYIGKALDRFFDMCNVVSELTFADETFIAVQSPGPKFRTNIYPNYKAHRQAPSQYSNVLVPELRERLVDMTAAVGSGVLETDDVIRIKHTELMKENHKPIVCSVDKDLLMIPGDHLRLKNNVALSQRITVNAYEARSFFYRQLLIGDPVDNVKGVPKIGPKSAEAKLAWCFEEEEFRQEVVNAYATCFKQGWRSELELTGNMLHLLRTPEDFFSLEGWPAPSY